MQNPSAGCLFWGAAGGAITLWMVVVSWQQWVASVKFGRQMMARLLEVGAADVASFLRSAARLATPLLVGCKCCCWLRGVYSARWGRATQCSSLQDACCLLWGAAGRVIGSRRWSAGSSCLLVCRASRQTLLHRSALCHFAMSSF
jgi:hypothetical protein